MKHRFASPWAWVPTLYFAEGIPYVAVMIISLIMYKRMGLSNTDITLYTSWLYLPWVIKPFWSPFILILFSFYLIVCLQLSWLLSFLFCICYRCIGEAFAIPFILILFSFYLIVCLQLSWLLSFLFCICYRCIGEAFACVCL